MTNHEVLRIRCIIEAVSAFRYGLNIEQLCYVLRDCDHPVEKSTSNEFTRTLDAKGFWRIDKEIEPELRLTVLTIVAFHDLVNKGLDVFIAQNNGDGWLIPETVKLADFALGHDERANAPQLVASRFGSRFLDWQASEDLDRSAKERIANSELIRRIVPSQYPTGDVGSTALLAAEEPAVYKQGGLF